jgi:hypothetical protein
MKATIGGKLSEIPDCLIKIPGAGDIKLNNLPEITDGKNAVYNNEAIIGRSFPLYTYSHSGDRTIGMQLHFFIVNPGDGTRNLSYLRKLQSAVYPRDGSNSGTPYQPPPICQIKCGQLLGSQDLCVVLQSYSVKFPTEVAWDEASYCPFRFDVDTTWLTVYTTADLPFQDRIVSSGR